MYNVRDLESMMAVSLINKKKISISARNFYYIIYVYNQNKMNIKDDNNRSNVTN